MKVVNIVGASLGIFGIYIAYTIGNRFYNKEPDITMAMTWTGIASAYLLLMSIYNLVQSDRRVKP